MRSSIIFSVITLFSAGSLAAPAVGADATLAAREPADNRPPPTRPGSGTGGDLGAAIAGIIAAAQNDRDNQAQFTQTMADELAKQYPHKNVLIFHDQKSKAELNGNQHSHKELRLDARPGTKGYEINVFDDGKFTLHGDGGYVNWAFNGCVKSRNGKVIEFCRR